MPAGPCVACGATNYPMSMGGPTICPPCDCGIPPKQVQLQRKLQEALARNVSYSLALTKALGLRGLITPEMEAEADRVIAEFRAGEPKAQ